MNPLVAFLTAVGFESVLSKQQIAERSKLSLRPVRDSGARYCGCGRRISANKGLCLACAELHSRQSGEA